MNIIILSGGSGKRLWPLSDDVNAKQFLDLFKTNEGYQSMLQHMYYGLKKVDKDASITIAANKKQEEIIKKQIGADVSISLEPSRRDTFPAIALATAYLKDVLKKDENEVVVVCSVDPFVDDDFFNCLKELFDKATNSDNNLFLVGIKPTRPSDKYGYIIPNSDLTVKEFKEKPDVETAKKYLKEKALWNAGIFAFKIKYILDKVNNIYHTSNYQELYDNYDSLKKISFDYEVVEKEKKIQVLEYNGLWEDVGTWDSFTKVLNQNIIGKALESNCSNTNIINNLNIPILAIGLDNVVIAANEKGIIITDKKYASQIKDKVEEIEALKNEK